MLNKREAERRGEENLGAVLGSGYRYHRASETFRTTSGNIIHSVGFPFWSWGDAYVFSVVMGTLSKEVQSLYSDLIERSEARNTVTSLIQAWQACGTKPPPDAPFLPNSGAEFYYTFSDEFSLKDALYRMGEVLTQKIIPFLESFQSIEDIHQFQNVKRIETSVCWMPKAVVVAYLADHSNWKKFASGYDFEMRDQSGPCRERLVKIVNGLNARD